MYVFFTVNSFLVLKNKKQRDRKSLTPVLLVASMHTVILVSLVSSCFSSLVVKVCCCNLRALSVKSMNIWTVNTQKMKEQSRSIIYLNESSSKILVSTRPMLTSHQLESAVTVLSISPQFLCMSDGFDQIFEVGLQNSQEKCYYI